MEKMTVSCQLCGKILTVIEKETISAEDLSDGVLNSYCETDGQVQIHNGQLNIIAVRTK
jgi:hypothetical protein